MTQTTVFQSGNSQAVRLPKDFRFNSKTVEIFRRGNEVVLREVPRTMGDLIKHLPNLGDDFPDDIAELDAMLDIIDEPQAADREIDYFSRNAGGDAKPRTDADANVDADADVDVDGLSKPPAK